MVLEVLPRPSSFQHCYWEVQSPFNCWSLVCDLFLSLGYCKIFLILKVMKFHSYGEAIFSFTVFGNHWASWTSKFMSLQFWKMFSPPCSLHSISETCTVGSLGFLDSFSNFLLFIPFSTLSFLLYFWGISSPFHVTLLFVFPPAICFHYPRIISVSKHYFLQHLILLSWNKYFLWRY